MRGEHVCLHVSPERAGGSSPHARGAPRINQCARPHIRIIPACAGSTAWPRSRWSRWRDHPRMRGEHTSASVRGIRNPGSSPHARGALHEPDYPRHVGRIIPACAGSTRPMDTLSARARDHPRMRGEHDTPVPACRPRGGIIPACAGSTDTTGNVKCFHRDHPRMRGEHGFDFRPSATFVGSSPHARGAPLVAYAVRGRHGIIPACAGSTARRQTARSPCRDHPRMRGEHAVAMLAAVM